MDSSSEVQIQLAMNTVSYSVLYNMQLELRNLYCKTPLQIQGWVSSGCWWQYLENFRRVPYGSLHIKDMLKLKVPVLRGNMLGNTCYLTGPSNTHFSV